MTPLPYAVVKFPTENLVGIVCSKWLTSDGKSCFYPASKAELFNMTLILKKEREAMPGWDRHPVVILGQYATYAEAKEGESKAEDTSNLSSDEEDETAVSKRKRIPSKKYDSSEDDSSSPPMKKSKCPKPPPLSTFSHSSSSYTQLKPIETVTTSPTEPTTHKNSQTNLFPNVGLLCTPPQKNIFQRPSTSSSQNMYPSPQCSFEDDISAICPSDFPVPNRFSTPQSRQRNSGEHLQVMGKLNHLIEMVSALNQRVDDLGQRMNQLGQIGISENKIDNTEDIFKCLPIDEMNEFDIFENRLEEEAFRKSFVKSMTALGGRDANTMLIGILKRLLTDKCAELFSLTGKKMGHFAAKRKFGDTRVCNSIIDAVRRLYKEATNDILKNTVKHWLQQATPRIQKRAKREESKKTTANAAEKE